jgi:predicted RNA-binding Zn ribbon-like protein
MAQPGGRPPAPANLVLAQDLANTIDIDMGRDILTSPVELVAFARAHGISGAFSRRDLVRLRDFRELLRDVCSTHAGFDPPEQAITRFNEVMQTAPLVISAAADGSASYAPAQHLTGAHALLSEIAAGIARAIAEGSWIRLKACEADTCRWVYYDRSPAGRSRWCTMKICGSRAKVRAYRARSGRDQRSRGTSISQPSEGTLARFHRCA